MASNSTGDGFPDVVVTAVASSTALAPDAEDTWQQLLEGQSGIRRLDKPFVDEFKLPVRIGGELREDFDQHLNRVELRRLSYMQKMSRVLSRRLWESAGTPEVDTRRLLVSIGIALGTTEAMIFLYDAFRERGMRAANPLAVQMHMPNAAAASVGLDRAAKAGVTSPVLADASGAAGIVEAWQAIVLGEADIAICGGVETRIEPVPVAAFHNLGWLSANNDDPAGACRPFDTDRDGMVFGEAGALMLIETEEHAKARGARILARVMGAVNHVRRIRRHRARPERRAGRRRHRSRDRAGRSDADGHRPCERARHRNTARRLGRGPRDPARTGRAQSCGVRAEGGAGSFIGGRGCGRGGADGAGPA